MRKLSKGIRLAMLAACAVVTGASQARAAAITLVTPGAEYGSGLFTLGFEFTVNSPYLVGSLGVYDSQQNGLNHAANVGIWLSTGGAPIASTVVPVGVGGQLDGMFRYAAIAPMLLNPGVHYVIGAFLPGDVASSLNTLQGGSGSIDPNVNIVMDRYSPFDAAFGFPSASDLHPNGAWLGANFRGAPAAAVPEPATMTLLGLGLVGLRAVRRRRQA